MRHVRKYTSRAIDLCASSSSSKTICYSASSSPSAAAAGTLEMVKRECMRSVVCASERCERARGLESLCVCVGAESDFHSDAERENELRGEYSNDGG